MPKLIKPSFPALLDSKGAAAYLSIFVRTLSRLEHRGLLRPSKFLRAKRWFVKELDGAIEESLATIR